MTAYPANISEPEDVLDTYVSPRPLEVSSATDPPNADEGTVALRLVPTERAIATGESTTFEIVADNVTRGIGSYELAVTSASTATVELTDASNRIGGSARRNLATDGSRVHLGAVSGDTSDTGTGTVATVTARGASAGRGRLSMTVESISDEQGEQYVVDSSTGATVTVHAAGAGPDVGTDGRPARDPDGDGRYEDVNGDGDVTPGDATVLFNAIFEAESAVVGHVDSFDFSGDGRLAPGDATVLFDEIFAYVTHD
jgi:hypothetical protein